MKIETIALNYFILQIGPHFATDQPVLCIHQIIDQKMLLFTIYFIVLLSQCGFVEEKSLLTTFGPRKLTFFHFQGIDVAGNYKCGNIPYKDQQA